LETAATAGCNPPQDAILPTGAVGLILNEIWKAKMEILGKNPMKTFAQILIRCCW